MEARGMSDRRKERDRAQRKRRKAREADERRREERKRRSEDLRKHGAATTRASIRMFFWPQPHKIRSGLPHGSPDPVALSARLLDVMNIVDGKKDLESRPNVTRR